jgi:hypothetical protein
LEKKREKNKNEIYKRIKLKRELRKSKGGEKPKKRRIRV